MNTLSRLTMVFRDIRRTIASSSGAPSYGSRHSRLEKSRDMNLMLSHICDNELLFFNQGRIRISKMHNARRTMEGIDAWTVGLLAHGTGSPLAALVRKRIETRVASKYHAPAPTPSEGFSKDRFHEDSGDSSETNPDSWSEDDFFEFDGESAGEEGVLEPEGNMD